MNSTPCDECKNYMNEKVQYVDIDSERFKLAYPEIYFIIKRLQKRQPCFDPVKVGFNMENIDRWVKSGVIKFGFMNAGNPHDIIKVTYDLEAVKEMLNGLNSAQIEELINKEKH